MKNKILSMSFCLFIFTFLIINLIVKDKDISYSERRYLTKLPDITLENILNGKIFDSFEGYATDNFVLRDEFRYLKTFTELNIFRKKDYNNIYLDNDYIYKIEYPLNKNKVIDFTTKMNNIYDTYLKNINVYYTIIPDKNYYSKNDYLKMDYNELIDIVNNNMNNSMKYIDITNNLDIDSYYYTDIHWKQEKLQDVVKTLSSNMNFKIGDNYKENSYEPFHGTYYGQLGLNTKPDKLVYLTNETIENAKVHDYESELNTVYETTSLGKMDSYDIYLGGASSIVEVTTDNNEEKELIIFRDSFGSSLAPLLLDGYKKITLIDLRYISPNLLNQYVSFDNQDVLIVYNTSIINNSDMIKKSS